MGCGVNIAARLESQCLPGEILTSNAVRERIEGRIEVGITPEGTRQLKNISDNFEVFRVHLEKITSHASAPTGRNSTVIAEVNAAQHKAVDATQKPRIAVFPFHNMSKNEDSEYLSSQGSKYPVSCIPQARQDIAVIAESTVDSSGVHRHVRVRMVHGVNPFRARQQAQEFDRFGLALLESRHGSHRRIARGQHRIHHHHVALVHVLGHLEVVLHGLQGLRVAVQADVPYTRTGHNRQHAIQNAVARTQDADENQLFAINMLTGHGLERGLDLHVLQGHVSAHFVGHQAAYFVEQLAKAVGAGVPIAHQGQLVLHQWVVNQVQIGTRGGVHGDDRRHGFSLNGVYPLIVPHFPLPRCAELSGSYQHMLCALTQMAYRALRLHFEVTLGIRSTVGDNQNKI
jgi:hypothetical protein